MSGLVDKKEGKLLQHLFSFETVAVKNFVAKDNFVEGKTTNDVSIVWLSDDFKNNFLGKIEKDIKSAKLKVQKLLKSAMDLPKKDEPGIIPELAGKHETMLVQFFQLLSHKQHVKDFTWIVGYILDENNVLWAVNAGWFGDGWYVGARSVERPEGWSVGSQFVSR